MGRILAEVTVRNATDPENELRFTGVVDTVASHLVLPATWRPRLGNLKTMRRVPVALANKEIVEGEVAGPVEVTIDGFDAVNGDALFVEMQPTTQGQYEPLIGYLVLEAIPVAVDMLGHRLVHAGALDLM
ncbi:MAG: hypothetical protein ACKVVT_15610 [Dehalococcoidia bacterium]